MTGRDAHCCCGSLRLTVSGEPVRISVCHCRQCQRRTGSPFGQQARFPKDQVRIDGESRAYERIADSGNHIRFHFCPNCGSTVYYEMEVDPENYGIPVGAFADPEFDAPWVSVYEEYMHHWVTLPEGVDHYD